MPGILLMDGMGLQIPAGALVLTLDDDGQPSMELRSQLLRLDLWHVWLEIGCTHAAQASDLGAKLSVNLPDEEKGQLLTGELQAAVVAVTACAFAFDGFYDTVRNELGAHPDEAIWKDKGTARHKQVTETLRSHFKLGPKSTAQLGGVMRELFGFRDRAVHPTSKFVPPNYRPEIDAGVHPAFVTFSGPHAVQTRALALTCLDQLVDRGLELAKPGADVGWLDKGRKELDRLIPLYRVPGDDELAFRRS